MSARGINLHDRELPAIVPPGCRLRPLREQVLVKIADFQWSDVIIETYRGRPVQGTVVACGPGRYRWRHKRGKRDGKDFHTISESAYFTPTQVKVGDEVFLGGLEHGGLAYQQVLMDGELHVLVSDQDIATAPDE